MLCLLAAAPAHAAPRPDPPYAPHQAAWPVAGREGAARPEVARGWEPPPAPWAAGHRGVDLAARPGQPVRAAAAGRVSFAGKVAGRGVVSIELSGSGKPPLRTTYEPVRPTIRKGDRVAAGEQVGTLTRGRHCLESCLHWGLLRAADYRDPLSLLPRALLGGAPVRLLPVHGVPLPRRDSASATERRPNTTPGLTLRPTVGTLRPTVGLTSGPAEGVQWPVFLVLAPAALWAHHRLKLLRRSHHRAHRKHARPRPECPLSRPRSRRREHNGERRRRTRSRR